MATRTTGVAAAVRTIRMVIATINSTRVKPFLRTARRDGHCGGSGPDPGTLLLSAAKTRLEKLRCTALSLVLPGKDFATGRPCSGCGKSHSQVLQAKEGVREPVSYTHLRAPRDRTRS